MTCPNCGAQNGNAAFCTACGAPLATAAQTAPSAPTYPSATYSDPSAYAPSTVYTPDPTAYGAPAAPKKPFKLFILLGAVGIVVIALLILLLNLGNIKARSIVKKALDSERNYNYATIVDLLPRGYLDEQLEEIDKDRNDFKDHLEDRADDAKDKAEERGSGFDYKITGVSKIKGDDLKDLQDYYDDTYDLKVSAAKSVAIEYVNKSHGRNNYKNYSFITVVKIGSKWYVDYGTRIYGDMLSDYISFVESGKDYDDYYDDYYAYDYYY